MATKHRFVITGVSEDAASGVSNGPAGPNEWNDGHDVMLEPRFLSADATIVATDEYIEVTSGSPNLTLPDATNAAVTKRLYTFLNAGSGVVTLSPVSAQTINGDTSYLLSNQWQFVRIYSNGTNWRVIGGN